MATKPTVAKNTGIFSTLFCVALLMAGYTFYLIQSNQALDVQAIALAKHWYQLKPNWAREIVADGGFSGTLAAVLMIMVQGMIYFGIAFAGTYFAMKNKLVKPGLADIAEAEASVSNPGVYSAEIQGSELMVILPKYPGAQKGKWLGGAVDNDPYIQNFYRIDRAPVKTRSDLVLSHHQKLYLALYSMLKAHSDVPASIGTHHADTPLFEHSLTVSKKTQEYFSSRLTEEPLAAIAGLAHDMDKLLAYKKNGTVWSKSVNATHHNKYSAYIVSTQPEFKALPENERNVLVLALRYYHDPDNLPIGASNRTEALIQALRISDGYAIKAEKASAVVNIDNESFEVIEKALLDTISELNINGYLSSSTHQGGWTTPSLEYVLAPFSTVLESLGKHLPSELNRKLQLDHETRTFLHPSSIMLTGRLEKLGVLMTNYKTFASERGLYDCRIGNTRFKSVLMIHKKELDKLIPGLLDKWGTATYRIRITGATVDSTVQGESDVDVDGEAN
jgi:hypothetical protein